MCVKRMRSGEMALSCNAPLCSPQLGTFLIFLYAFDADAFAFAFATCGVAFATVVFATIGVERYGDKLIEVR